MDTQIIMDAYNYQRYMATGYKSALELLVASGKITLEDANQAIGAAFGTGNDTQPDNVNQPTEPAAE